MCSINHDLKAIFIHNHKSGGTYISYMLHTYYGFKNYYLRRPDHDKFCLNKKKTTKYINYENRLHGVLVYYMTSPELNRKMNMNEHKWNTYYKFAFIRNPYDKIISAWYHINRFNIPFQNYINLNKTCNDVEYMHMFLPQIRNLIDKTGKININYIGHFEKLEEDFQIILKNIGIKNIIHDTNKKLNKRNHQPFYTYYNQETLNKVNELLKEDFKYLNFKKFINIYDFYSEYVDLNELKETLQQDTLQQNTLHQDTLHQDTLQQNTLQQNTLQQNTLHQDTLHQNNIMENNSEQDNILKVNYDHLFDYII